MTIIFQGDGQPITINADGTTFVKPAIGESVKITTMLGLAEGFVESIEHGFTSKQAPQRSPSLPMRTVVEQVITIKLKK